MALVTRDPAASPDASNALVTAQIAGLVAAEDIDAAAPCYIASDGRVRMSNGTADNAAAKVHGFSYQACKAGAAVTLAQPGARFRYATGLTPGAPLYLAATAGRLDTAVTTGGKAPIAIAVAATDILFTALAQ
jgi:hypothetical protein